MTKTYHNEVCVLPRVRWRDVNVIGNSLTLIRKEKGELDAAY